MNIYLYANILKFAHHCGWLSDGQFSSYSFKILIRLGCRTLKQLLRMLKGAWKSTKRENFCFCEVCFGSLGYRAPCYWKFSHCTTTSFVHSNSSGLLSKVNELCQRCPLSQILFITFNGKNLKVCLSVISRAHGMVLLDTLNMQTVPVRSKHYFCQKVQCWSLAVSFVSSPPTSHNKWLSLPEAGFARRFFLLKWSFSFPMLPSAPHRGL